VKALTREPIKKAPVRKPRERTYISPEQEAFRNALHMTDVHEDGPGCTFFHGDAERAHPCGAPRVADWYGRREMKRVVRYVRLARLCREHDARAAIPSSGTWRNEHPVDTL
jgi:hypothetical protein